MMSSDNFQISICKNDFKYVSLKQIFSKQSSNNNNKNAIDKTHLGFVQFQQVKAT